jgi:hypothetical protein
MGIAQNFIIVPPSVFFAFHLLGGWLIGRTFTAIPHAIPIFIVIFAIQGVIEHYSDRFPTVAKANMPLTLALLVLLVYWLYTLFAISTAPHWMIVSAIVFYFVVVGCAKAFNMGFPMDTADEQIKALQDPAYNFYHLMLHIILTLVFGFLSLTCPGQDMWSKPLIDL